MLADKANHVTAVDLSESALVWSQMYHDRPNLTQVRGDACTFGKTESFDKVISMETIEHIQEDVALVQNFWRVLKPGGMLICSVPNETVLKLGKYYRNQHHVRHYTLKGLLNLLESVGFEIIDFHAQFKGHVLQTSLLDPIGSLGWLAVASKRRN